MKQFKVDVFLNGNFYDSFYRFGISEDDVEEQVGNEIQIEFETEEI